MLHSISAYSFEASSVNFFKGNSIHKRPSHRVFSVQQPLKFHPFIHNQFQCRNYQFNPENLYILKRRFHHHHNHENFYAYLSVAYTAFVVGIVGALLVDGKNEKEQASIRETNVESVHENLRGESQLFDAKGNFTVESIAKALNIDLSDIVRIFESSGQWHLEIAPEVLSCCMDCLKKKGIKCVSRKNIMTIAREDEDHFIHFIRISNGGNTLKLPPQPKIDANSDLIKENLDKAFDDKSSWIRKILKG